MVPALACQLATTITGAGKVHGDGVKALCGKFNGKRSDKPPASVHFLGKRWNDEKRAAWRLRVCDSV